MNTKRPLAAVPPGTTVVTMPGEMTYDNAADVHAELIAAMGPRTTTVIVDLTGTTFCDTAGLREMITAHRLAEASGIDLRLVVPGSLMRTFTMAGVDRLLSLHPTPQRRAEPGPASGLTLNVNEPPHPPFLPIDLMSLS